MLYAIYYQKYIKISIIALTIYSANDIIESIKIKKVIKGRRLNMDLHRYDVIEAEINYDKGSLQNKKRPYIIVSNETGTTKAPIITVMPLTHVIKKQNLPVHGCIEAKTENGLRCYSMILGEQPQTINKKDVIKKIGTVTNKPQRNMVNKVCFNTFFFGENIDWEEVMA